MLIILSICSIPSISSYLPGRFLFLNNFWWIPLHNISFINELLPEPDTPVMQHNIPRGILTSIFLRLFSLAPLISINLSSGFLLLSGTSIFFLPLRYCPVIESSHFFISSSVPQATTSPPCIPAPGPISSI